MKKLSLIIASIVIILLGCDKENPTGPGDTLNEKVLKIVFSNNYCQAEGWVIVYSEDGSTVIDTAKFFGDATVDFGEIALDRITFTIITTQISSSFKSYIIQTYYSVKKGEWKLSNPANSVKGKLDVSMTFPNKSYDHVLLSFNSGYEAFGLTADTVSSLHFPLFDVYNTNPNNSLSIYSSVYNRSEGFGYYNWAPSINFVQQDTNSYNVSLTRSLVSSQIEFNKEVSGINIEAYSSLFSGGIKLFENYNSQSLTTQKVLLPDEISNSSYKIFISNRFNNYIYQYKKVFSTMPSFISIPNTTVSATHNSSNNSIENITVNGTIDFFTAVWSLSNINNNNFIWIAYAPNNYKSIVRPELPLSITSQIGNLNTSQMELYDLIVEENNKFSSFDDLINYYFKSTVPITNNFTEQYSYGLLF